MLFDTDSSLKSAPSASLGGGGASGGDVSDESEDSSSAGSTSEALEELARAARARSSAPVGIPARLADEVRALAGRAGVLDFSATPFKLPPEDAVLAEALEQLVPPPVLDVVAPNSSAAREARGAQAAVSPMRRVVAATWALLATERWQSSPARDELRERLLHTVVSICVAEIDNANFVAACAMAAPDEVQALSAVSAARSSGAGLFSQSAFIASLRAARESRASLEKNAPASAGATSATARRRSRSRSPARRSGASGSSGGGPGNRRRNRRRGKSGASASGSAGTPSGGKGNSGTGKGGGKKDSARASSATPKRDA